MSRYMCHLVGIMGLLVRAAGYGFSAVCDESAGCSAGGRGSGERGRVRAGAWGVGAYGVPASGPDPCGGSVGAAVEAATLETAGDPDGARRVGVQGRGRTRSRQAG